MKKLAILVMAMLLTAMFTAPAFAEDRLSLSGSYFVRGWDVDSGKAGPDQNYYHQRMRVQAKIAVADDVSATIRADIAEAVWGADFTGPSVARPGNAGDNDSNKIHIDRTFVTIDKEAWSFQAGQQFFALGIAEVMDSQITGFNAGLKFAPVNVNFIYAKIDEGDTYDRGTLIGDGTIGGLNDAQAAAKAATDATTDEAALGTEDTDIYAVNVGFEVAGFNSNAFGVMQKDDSPAQAEPWAIGFMTSGTAAGMVNILAELDFFGGDNATNDYSGVNFYVKGDVAINDMFTVGAEVIYGDGDDTDTQISGLTDWDTFTPFSIGTPMDGWVTAFAGSPFDMTGDGAGTIGGTLFVSSTPMEKLSLGGKVGYFETEEDSVTDADMVAFNAWVAYEIASNTKVSMTYLYSDIDEQFINNDAVKTIVLELAVSF